MTVNCSKWLKWARWRGGEGEREKNGNRNKIISKKKSSAPDGSAGHGAVVQWRWWIVASNKGVIVAGCCSRLSLNWHFHPRMIDAIFRASSMKCNDAVWRMPIVIRRRLNRPEGIHRTRNEGSFPFHPKTTANDRAIASRSAQWCRCWMVKTPQPLMLACRHTPNWEESTQRPLTVASFQTKSKSHHFVIRS